MGLSFQLTLLSIFSLVAFRPDLIADNLDEHQPAHHVSICNVLVPASQRREQSLKPRRLSHMQLSSKPLYSTREEHCYHLLDIIASFQCTHLGVV